MAGRFIACVWHGIIQTEAEVDNHRKLDSPDSIQLEKNSTHLIYPSSVVVTLLSILVIPSMGISHYSTHYLPAAVPTNFWQMLS